MRRMSAAIQLLGRPFREKRRVDPCGENGEFHTFVTGGPMLKGAIAVSRGEVVERDGFVFADLLPEERDRDPMCV
jgi:diphthamide synthase (EF-2-diphthine--ammonia ligase)